MATKIQEKKKAIRYKPYDQDIVIELPILLREVVKDNALVCIVNEVVNRIPIEKLWVYYSGKGCPAFHPLMLIKVWVYGFCNKVYTSRPLAKKLREDLCYMWLAGGQRPCFKTLSEFRGNRMEGIIEEVFKETLMYLVEKGYVDLNDLYIDGSKWEANANQHKINWRKNTERYKLGVEERIVELLGQIKQLQRQEDSSYADSDLESHVSEEQIKLDLSSGQLHQHIVKVNELVEQQNNKKKKRKLQSLNNKLSKETEKIEKYEYQEETLAGRNSYSRTDEDATAMRMKDDSLKPGYNPQISTSNQYIVNATIHQNASDSVNLPEHIEQLEERVKDIVPADWSPDYTGDAGYGSEENYELLAEKQMTAYLKYPSWFAEQSGQIKKKTYNKYNWTYEQQGDYFLCPQGKKIHFLQRVDRANRNGYIQHLKVYQSEGCKDCPVFKECRGDRAKKDSNRKVFINEDLEVHKEKARQRLNSEEGVVKRATRSTDVETPFGDIKYNRGHRRFILRGLEKVNIEFLLLCIAHNLKKVYCEVTGIWSEYYAQRASRRATKKKKGK